MSNQAPKLPDKVGLEHSYDYGYSEHRRPEQEIVDDLVRTVNQLIEYLQPVPPDPDTKRKGEGND